jgi:hypothetical protein
MSQSNLKAKAEKRSKAAIWFNNIFRTKLEIESDKILEMMQSSNDNQVRGDTTFFYSRSGLEKDVEAKYGKEPKFIKLTSLSVTYWCDVPKKLWKEFQSDGGFNQQLYEQVNALTARLIGEWVNRLQTWERVAAEADAKGDKDGVDRAIKEFDKDCGTLSKECEVVAIETIAGFFTEKAQTFGDYKRYKAKAGAKLVSTTIGMALSLAALATAATPAAPATLVPALIGLVSAAMSTGKQIADLAASAEEIEAEIRVLLGKIEINYKDKDGKPKKKTYQARELTAGFVSGLTGGASDIVFPSIKGLSDETGLHKSKLDGLDTKLHDMGININSLVDGLVSVDTVLQANLKALEQKAKAKPGDKDVKAAQKALMEAMKKFETLNANFLSSFDAVPVMIKRIEGGREENTKFKEALEKIESALKTKNFALVGNIISTLALAGIGFSGGPPTQFLESVTNYTSLGWTGIDQIREYTPDVMEKVLG